VGASERGTCRALWPDARLPGGKDDVAVFREGFQTDHCEPDITASRAHLADILLPEAEGRAGLRSRPLDRDRHQTPADETPVFRAGRQLLADIATLVPVDPVQLVEAALEQEGFLHR